jgi:hypothetical protein
MDKGTYAMFIFSRKLKQSRTKASMIALSNA